MSRSSSPRACRETDWALQQQTHNNDHHVLTAPKLRASCSGNKHVVFPSRWGKPPHPSLSWHTSCPILDSHRSCLCFPRVLGKTVWRAPVIIDTFSAWAFCLALGQRYPCLLSGFHTLSLYLLLNPCVSTPQFVPLSTCPLSMLHLVRWHNSLVRVLSINFLAYHQTRR